MYLCIMGFYDTPLQGQNSASTETEIPVRIQAGVLIFI